MVQSVADTIQIVLAQRIEQEIINKDKNLLATDAQKYQDEANAVAGNEIIGPEDIDFGVDFENEPSQQHQQNNDINFESDLGGDKAFKVQQQEEQDQRFSYVNSPKQ